LPTIIRLPWASAFCRSQLAQEREQLRSLGGRQARAHPRIRIAERLHHFRNTLLGGGRQMQCIGAQIAPRTPLHQTAFDQEVDELHRARTVDAERAAERGLVKVGIGANQQ